MPRDINFLRNRRQSLTKTQQTDQKYMRWTAAVTGSILVITLVVAGARIFMGTRINQIEQLQRQARQAILSQESVERTFVLTFHKVKVLSELFEQRQNKQEAINFFSNVFGPQVLVKQIEFDSQEQILTFRLEADDVFVLEQVFTELAGDQVQSQFERVTANDLRRNEDGTYQMSVVVVLMDNQDRSNS